MFTRIKNPLMKSITPFRAYSMFPPNNLIDLIGKMRSSRRFDELTEFTSNDSWKKDLALYTNLSVIHIKHEKNILGLFEKKRLDKTSPPLPTEEERKIIQGNIDVMAGIRCLMTSVANKIRSQGREIVTLENGDFSTVESKTSVITIVTPRKP